MKTILFFLFTIWIGLGSRSSFALTLGEVINAVQNQHPSIEQARQEAKSAKAEKEAESWLPDPMVGIGFEEVPFNSPSLGNADMTHLSVSQEIPFPGTLISKAKSMDKEYRAKKALIDSAIRARVFDAKKTYFELLANQHLITAKNQALSSYRQLVASLEEQYASTRSSKKTINEMGMGKTSQMDTGSLFSDLLMAKMKKVEVEAELHDLHHQHKSLEAKINLLMGRKATVTINPLGAIPIKKLKNQDVLLKEKIFRQNSDLLAMEWMVKKFKNEKTFATFSLVPTVETEFTYQKRQNMDNAYMLTFGLNIPLWFNKDKAILDRAKANALKANAELETQKRNLETDFYYLVNHAHEHYKIVKKYRDEIVPLAKSMASTALVAYESRMITSLNMLQKVIGAQDASSMYWKMWLDYQTEIAMLEQLAGEEL